MGYEVNYNYHEKINGEYNKEEIKTFKKKVGDPFEDITLEQLATTIMAQLARRDIWITDVKIFELTKKQVSFKEAKGGLIIKNKKIVLDGSKCVIQSIDESSDESEISENPPDNKNIEKSKKIVVNKNINTENIAPIFSKIYSPELRNHELFKLKGINLTVDKVYDIIKAEPISFGLEKYYILDDNGKKVSVDSDNFLDNNKISLSWS